MYKIVSFLARKGYILPSDYIIYRLYGVGIIIRAFFMRKKQQRKKENDFTK